MVDVLITGRDEFRVTSSRMFSGKTTQFSSTLVEELLNNAYELQMVIERLSSASEMFGPEDGREGHPKEPRSLVVDLKPRAMDVLGLMAQGLSNRTIAERLVLQTRTVENYINYIYQTLSLTQDEMVHPRVKAVLDFNQYTAKNNMASLTPAR